jgi:peptidoglycan/xylan/chitin deacetylase (PgdA/CDA1 family)
MTQRFGTFLTEDDAVKYPYVHLCFDDHSVSNWYALRDLLNKYQAKVVFYVDSFHLLGSDELQMLRDLRLDGHVIGCHGKSHKDAIAYSRRFNVEQYIDDEILPAMENMAGAGFKPTHFAFPLSHFDDVLCSSISPLFCYIRPGNKSYYYSSNNKMYSSRLDKEVTDKQTHIRAGDIQQVLNGLQSTADAKKGIIIVFHDVRLAGAQAHEGTHGHEYITPEELEQILKKLNEVGFGYETFEKICKYGADPFDKPDALV